MAPTHTSTDNPMTLLDLDAVGFLTELERRFRPRRTDLLAERDEALERRRRGEQPGFLDRTAAVRSGAWQIAPPPKDLLDHRVELITRPEPTALAAGLRAGANVVTIDFDDIDRRHVMVGHAALAQAIAAAAHPGEAERGVSRPALVVRPRGWYASDASVLVDGSPMSASLFDFGLSMFHHARTLLDRGSGPYFVLPKLQNHHEARLWNDVFCHAQDALGVERGSVKANVPVETLAAAFEMNEILYELREHGAGLAAGRWDYLADTVRGLGHQPGWLLPDRADLSHDTPLLRACADLLVAVAHRRGAHAIGRISSFVPDGADRATADEMLTRVGEAKRGEAHAGFDGSRVGHPGLVPVTRAAFDEVLGRRPNQIERQRDDVSVTESQLIDATPVGGAVTTAGVRGDVARLCRYLHARQAGSDAAIYEHLDLGAGSAELSRSQLWQQLTDGLVTRDGTTVDRALVEALAADELQAIGADRDETAAVTTLVSLVLGDEHLNRPITVLTSPDAARAGTEITQPKTA